ncbi:MAG: DUF1992 domain-containing protein [Peptococcaceae bacterium]|jgi:hypothetical protein|nr:DUF1992 domain-containing protein [Peptococcaceae bacterium]NLM20873.1 DUF1992 domain-containing protein [Peptococcaceae bacterium]
MTFNIFAKIALAKIEEAIKNGELDNLPGQGKPLDLAYLDMVPPEMRPAYSVLRNSGYLPVEASLLKEMANVKQELELGTHTEEQKEALINKLRDLELKYNLARESLRKNKKSR